MKRTLTAVPVMPATLNVIEKSGVGRRSKSPCVYIAVGAAAAARNRSRNGLRRAFVIVGVAEESTPTTKASTRAGGKSNPRFPSGGNSCARMNPLSYSNRNRIVDAFAGSIICTSSSDDRARSTAGTKRTPSNASLETARPSISTASVCRYILTNHGKV